MRKELVVGIIEPRPEELAKMDTETCLAQLGAPVLLASYNVLSLSDFGSDRSCFGVELWVHEQGPCSPDSVVVLHGSPTVLVAGIHLGDRQYRVLVGHAPHRGHTEQVCAAWWKSTTAICHSFTHGCPWIFLIDANCRVGSRCSAAIDQADSEDFSGALFHSLLLSLDLWLPATFEVSASGPGGTLYQKRSLALCRSDYLALPWLWRNGGFVSWVAPEITSGHPCVDHLAVVARGALPQGGGASSVKRAVRIDPQALLDPGNREEIARIIQDAPRPAWEVDASEHAAEVVDHLYTSLSARFPVARRRMRASFLSDSTAALHRAVSSLRHSVRHRTAALRLSFLRCVFLVWRSPAREFSEVFCGLWLWRLRTRLGNDCMLLRRFGAQLRQACREDKARHLIALSDEIADAGSREVHRAVQRVLRPRKFRQAPNEPLPQLAKPDGSLCSTASEITDTWREHFRVLEGGVDVSPQLLVRRVWDSQRRVVPPNFIEAAELPTWMSLEAAFRHSAPRKAPGPDLLPPAICRLFSTSLADLFWPLLLKTVCRIEEPAGMKGGVLFHISKGKPGLQSTCDAHRGILAQSCLSKAFHRSLRKLVVNHWADHALPLQIGGRAGCSAVFGHFCSRSVLRFAHQRRFSAALLFVDLAAAYYAVIRETLMGANMADRPLSEVAGALGLSDEDLQRLRHYVHEEPVLVQQNASEHFLALTRELHQQTWFVLSADSRLIETQRGTRPGGTLADVLFNVLFGRVLLRRQTPAMQQFFPMVPWDGVRTPFPKDLTGAPLVRVSDVVYADDLCTPIVCERAVQLRPAVSLVATETMDVLTPHALRANLGPTKTAAVVAPLGDGSRQARHEMFVTLKGRVPLWPETKGLLWLDLVPRYRHLGSLVSYDGRLGPEVRHRLALASAAFREGKRKLFACKRVPLEKRSALMRSHVLSVLLVGSGSWPLLDKRDCASFSCGIIGLYRQLLGLRASGDWHQTRNQLLARVGLPSPLALLHCERLRFLRQLVKDAPDQVWALLAWNDTYRAALREAGRWFLDAAGNTCSLKRAELWDVEVHRVRSVFDGTVRELWVPASPPQDSNVAGLEHCCLLCGLAFTTFRQWGTHAQRKHGYRNLATRLAVGRRCLSCNTLYASQAKLRCHLIAVPKCCWALQLLHGSGHASQPAAGSTEGHSQAPAVRGPRTPLVVWTEEELCLELLFALRALREASDQQIYDLVASFVEPLPVLRGTLRRWISELEDAALIAAAEDVLLVLWPEHLCSEIGGRAVLVREDVVFDPVIEPCLLQRGDASSPVQCLGCLVPEWARAWGIEALPVKQISLDSLSDAVGQCSGLCVTVPPPPRHFRSMLQPPSVPLRSLREQIRWTLDFLALCLERCFLWRAGPPADPLPTGLP
ncbi:unnamed protein product [Symbiodinium sp. CCMP2592]|nr:unnamed protein product [Symbiodinium sp. CCMP2592]